MRAAGDAACVFVVFVMTFSVAITILKVGDLIGQTVRAAL